ncbi:MAG: aerobic carbon-monoxide dehydrogenase large subunit, partial [Actinomycetota bacterium]|nr:aerobic carbon-monoxide dehydrogenase large subunit [Actinomycetota bacterium]
TAPGVVAGYTGRDLDLGPEGIRTLGFARGKPNPIQQPLAVDKVRYPGEPVAALVGRDLAQVLDALEAVEVDYEHLPVVGDARSALTGDVLVHDNISGNVCSTHEQGMGDIDAVLARSDIVVRRRLALPRVAPIAMEPRATVAAPEGDGYTVWSSTQTPHLLRHELAEATGIPADRLRVIAPDVGGAFGGKVCTYAEDIIALEVARRLGRPVGWTATRSEDLATTAHGRVVEQDVTIGATSEGRLLALKVDLLSDVGAYYSPVGPGSAIGGAGMYPGIYRFEAFALTGAAVLTNRAPVGAYRGAGRPEATFAIERAVDEVAAELGVDPVELRRRNWVTEFPYESVGGETFDVGDHAAATDRALGLLDYAGLRAEQQARRDRTDPVQLGIGVCTYVEVCGGSIEITEDAREAASVRLLPTGGAEVTVGSSPYGTGHATSWSQLVEDVLGVPVDQVRVIHGDTAMAPLGFDSYGSRSLVVVGAAVHQAATETRRKAVAVAAELLEADASDLELIAGAFRVKGVPSATVPLREVALASYDGVGGAEPGLPSVCGSRSGTLTYPHGTHLVAAEVDTQTGFVRLRRYVAVDDVGVVVNPLIVDGQVHGGVAQGIGEALYEEAAYDESGNLVTATLVDLTPPAAPDLPAFVTDRTCTPSPATPLGVKGAGEAGAIGSLAAVVNAVHDAVRHLGVTEVPVPCTPERVWRAIADARS